MADRWLVYGWAAKLPEPLKTKCENDMRGKLFQGGFFDNMIDAIGCIAKELDSDFYRGVYQYIRFKEMPIIGSSRISQDYRDGWNSANSAYEAQAAHIGLPPLTERHSTIPTYQVTELWEGGDIVPVPRMDYEALTRKAALYGELKAKLDAAIASLEDLRRLFV